MGRRTPGSTTRRSTSPRAAAIWRPRWPGWCSSSRQHRSTWSTRCWSGRPPGPQSHPRLAAGAPDSPGRLPYQGGAPRRGEDAGAERRGGGCDPLPRQDAVRPPVLPGSPGTACSSASTRPGRAGGRWSTSPSGSRTTPDRRRPARGRPRASQIRIGGGVSGGRGHGGRGKQSPAVQKRAAAGGCPLLTTHDFDKPRQRRG